MTTQSKLLLLKHSTCIFLNYSLDEFDFMKQILEHDTQICLGNPIIIEMFLKSKIILITSNKHNCQRQGMWDKDSQGDKVNQFVSCNIFVSEWSGGQRRMY